MLRHIGPPPSSSSLSETPHLSSPSSRLSPSLPPPPRRFWRSSPRNNPRRVSIPTPNLRHLTNRVVDLTRRKQLRQIFEEVEVARRKYGRLNTIVMNAVMEACVHCGDVEAALSVFQEMKRPESCGVDSITYGILLKGLGEARKIDEAFHILESVEKGTAVGTPKLSSQLLYGLLNALLETGDMRRANGLLARYRLVLREEGNSIVLYNLLMKGYANTDFPLGALAVRDEVLRNGLKPDRMTYNTLIFACVKAGRTDAAFRLFTEMKVEAEKADNNKLHPDSVTYTTLLKGLGIAGDLLAIQNIVVEMKACEDLFIDRVAYTAIVDSLLACGSTKGALCVFGEILKQSSEDLSLKPKPHLYLSMMRVFADRGDFKMVKKLHVRMWSDSAGTITSAAQREADELLMEAAINNDEIHTARKILSSILKKQKWISWRSRGGMVAVRLEAMSGFSRSVFNPYILHQVSLDDPVEKYMTLFEETNPLQATVKLREVVMRFYKDSSIPLIDDWGSCVGIVHREDCKELDAPLSLMTRGPPPCVTTSTSIGRVIELLLDKKYKMVLVVRANNVYQTSYSSSSRPAGVFTYEQLFKLAIPVADDLTPSTCSEEVEPDT